MRIKGIFCHDLPIYKDINGTYCSTTLTDDLFRRYFSVVDELFVATRVYRLDCTYVEAHQEKISLPNMQFLEFPNMNKPQYAFTLLPKAKKYLEKIIEEMDVVFIRGGIIGDLGVKAARKLEKPYLIEVAGCAWDSYWYHSIIGKIIAPYMEIQCKKAVRDAAFAIYVTEKWLQERYPTNGKSTFASNVILKEVDVSALEKRIRKIESCRCGKPWIIGTTGGINNKTKGQQFVIKAIAKLREKYDIKYELVGGGDNSYLKRVAKKYHVSDCVVFKGELSHEEVLSWLDSIDTYIQPSMQEGLPRALIEAMSRACPAIGSTTGGIPELLDQRVIFEKGKVSKLIEVMDYFYKSNWVKQAERNYKKAREYRIDLLNQRRKALYIQYKEYVLAKKK